MKHVALFFVASLMLSVALYAQVDVLEFVQKKPTTEGQVVYFDVVGIHNQDHANVIMEDFLDDPNVFGGRYFISSANKDRYQLNTNTQVSAAYVLSILQRHGVDFDYSSVSRNGYVIPEDHTPVPVGSGAKRTDVNQEGFPKYKNTGNKIEDDRRYAEEKNKWIQENPEQYEQLLKQGEKK